MDDSPQIGMPRRTFLLSSLGCAGFLLPGSVRRALATTRDGCGSPERNYAERLRVGYLPGSDRLPGFAGLTHATDGFVDSRGDLIVDEERCTELLWGRVIDAVRVSDGDPAFDERGVRLQIHGMFAAPGTPLDALPALDVYAHARPFQPIPFHVWGANGQTAAPNANVFVPVGWREGLTLSFDIHDAGCDRPADGVTPIEPEYYADHLFARFGFGNRAGTLKLRRGLYVIAWNTATASRLPSLGGCEIEVARADIERQVDQPGTLCSRLTRPDTFFSRPLAYVLLSIDHADVPEDEFALERPAEGDRASGDSLMDTLKGSADLARHAQRGDA